MFLCRTIGQPNCKPSPYPPRRPPAPATLCLQIQDGRWLQRGGRQQRRLHKLRRRVGMHEAVQDVHHLMHRRPVRRLRLCLQRQLEHRDRRMREEGGGPDEGCGVARGRTRRTDDGNNPGNPDDDAVVGAVNAERQLQILKKEIYKTRH